LDGETTVNLDMSILWPDGKQRPLLVNSAPVRDAAGRLIGAVGLFQDISEHIELRDRLAYQAQVLETVHDAIISTDAGGSITSWNLAAESLYGWSADEMIGRRDFETLLIASEHVLSPETRATELARLVQGEVLTYRRVHRHRSGRRIYVEITTAAMVGEDGAPRGYVASIRDQTENQQAEMALRQYAARLERSNRDLEDFAFIASHDLQEPLRKVRAFGDLLLNTYQKQLDERGADYVDRMVVAAVRMQKMLDSLLAYSRVSTRGQPFEMVDLNTVAAAALEDLENRIKVTGGQVEIEPLPAIQGDPQQLEMVFLNLIGNGLKFHAPGVPPLVRVRANLRQDGMVDIIVSDNGVGFSMEFAERLFQPFQRLHGRSAFEGSGVGLAICRKIAERHGGSIRGDSPPGEGAIFVVTLPVVQPENPDQEMTAFDAKAAHESNGE
jgi:PAS domain S-box-containing protein